MATDQAAQPYVAGAYNGGEHAVPQEAESGWSFVAFIWRRKWLVVFAAVVALGLGYVYFLRQTPSFQSSAQLLIVSNTPSLPIQGLEVNSEYDRTREALLRSPLIIDSAIKKFDLGSLPSLRGVGDPVSAVISGLKVAGTDTKSGNIIQMTYQSAYRDDCPKILNAIASAYQDFLGDTYDAISKDTVDLIEKAKTELDVSITALESSYATWRSTSPLLNRGEAAHNVHEERLASIEGVRAAAVLENTKLQAKIDAIQSALKSGARREALRFMIQQLQAIGPVGAGDSIRFQQCLFLQQQGKKSLLDG